MLAIRIRLRKITKCRPDTRAFVMRLSFVLIDYSFVISSS